MKIKARFGESSYNFDIEFVYKKGLFGL